MVFDIKRHQENRMKFLAVLYESCTEYASVIGPKAGLSREDTDLICRELLEERLVFGESLDGDHGPKLTMNPSGLALFEKYQSEKSSQAREREAVAFGKEKSAKMAKARAARPGRWRRILSLLGWH